MSIKKLPAMSFAKLAPIFITGALDFQKGKAYIAVPHKILEEAKLKSQIFLITSDRQKVFFSNESLLEQGLYAERRPFLFPRWQWEDIEKFLGGEPAPELEALYQSIVELSEKYLDFSDKRFHKVTALWIIGTYFHRFFSAYPYIHLNGNAGAGKTKGLSLIALLGFNGELSVNNTPSYMIRVIHNNHATCCIDEVEKLDKTKDEDSKTILAMLNAGYKKGSFVGKSEQSQGSKNWEPKRFEAYSPKVIAGIKNLPPTLASRCIPVVMVKSSNPAILNAEISYEDEVWGEIRNGLYRAALEHYTFIKTNYAVITDQELLGRAWELWKPILSLAEAINGVLYNEMREFALEIELQKREMETDMTSGPHLLQGLLELVHSDVDEEKFHSVEEICGHLVQYDEDEYDWLKQPENKTRRGKWLGNELRRAGVIKGKAEQKKIGGKNTKGYCFKAADIDERLKSFGLYQEPDKNINQGDQNITMADEKVPVIPF